MPVDIGRVWCGPLRPAATIVVQEAVDDVRKGGRILKDSVPGSACSDTG